jgi:hypothetical protein
MEAFLCFLMRMLKAISKVLSRGNGEVEFFLLIQHKVTRKALFYFLMATKEVVLPHGN